MRQAIVITNPKWEPFTAASDAFKKLKLKDNESAVLVVRGRSKERRSAKEKPPVTKSEPDSKEAMAADLRKQGVKPEEIEKAVAASKLPSIHDKVKKSAALVLALCLFSFSAAAQGLNLLGYLPSTTIVGSSTNSTAGQGKIGWNLGAEAVFQLSLNSTNYAGSAVTVDLAISDNGSDWITNQIAIACTPLGQFATNTATAISRETNSAGAKWLQVNQVRNPNTNTITIQRFDVSVYNPQ